MIMRPLLSKLVPARTQSAFYTRITPAPYRRTITAFVRAPTSAPSGGLAAIQGRTRSIVSVSFLSPKDGTLIVANGREGETLLDVAIKNDVEMEGACSGQCACSTCHVIVAKEFFDKLPEADEDELDMLDLAMHVEDTSRLACQIRLSKELDGMKVELPEGFNNLFG